MLSYRANCKQKVDLILEFMTDETLTNSVKVIMNEVGQVVSDDAKPFGTVLMLYDFPDYTKAWKCPLITLAELAVIDKKAVKSSEMDEENRISEENIL